MLSVTAALTGEGLGDEVALLTDPFFQISSPPGAHLKDFCLAVGRAGVAFRGN